MCLPGYNRTLRKREVLISWGSVHMHAWGDVSVKPYGSHRKPLSAHKNLAAFHLQLKRIFKDWPHLLVVIKLPSCKTESSRRNFKTKAAPAVFKGNIRQRWNTIWIIGWIPQFNKQKQPKFSHGSLLTWGLKVWTTGFEGNFKPPHKSFKGSLSRGSFV